MAAAMANLLRSKSSLGHLQGGHSNLLQASRTRCSDAICYPTHIRISRPTRPDIHLFANLNQTKGGSAGRMSA